jgi:propanediol dehydratase small subunit
VTQSSGKAAVGRAVTRADYPDLCRRPRSLATSVKSSRTADIEWLDQVASHVV